MSPYEKIEDDIEFWKSNYLKKITLESESLNTYKLKERVLNELREFAFLERVNGQINSLKEANQYFIRAFLEYLKDRGVSNNTLVTYFKNIKAFFKFISEENEEGVDLYYRIEKIKVSYKRKEPQRYLDDEIKKIVKNLKNEILLSNNYAKVRNRLMILFLIYTGMRANEVLNLKIDDFQEDSENYVLKIVGKGNKERINFIKKEFLQNEVEKFLKLRERKIVSKYLFSKKDGNKLSYIALWKFNKKILEELGLKNKGLHAYRHYFAVKAIENNISLQILSEWLGHSSIQITSEFYAKANITAKKLLANSFKFLN